MSHFFWAFRRLHGIEGGYVDHPDDSGGATRWGITEAVAKAHGYAGRMAELPQALAEDIYFADYWNPIMAFELAEVHVELAYEVFDSAVNVGVPRASEWLQRCLNVLNLKGAIYPDLVEDGVIGARTLKALEAYVEHRGQPGIRVLLKMLNSLQGHFYIALAERRQKDESFVYGWFEQRVTYAAI